MQHFQNGTWDLWGPRSRCLTLFGSLLLIAFLGALDCLTGWEHSFPVAYLLPIYCAVRIGGRWPGVITALASAISWLIADLITAPHYSRPGIPFENALVRLGLFLLFASLLTSLQNALEREKLLANTDSLTGINNRRSFFHFARLEIARARRYQHPFTVAYVDLDNFKAINDKHGHQQGDALLRRVAQTFADNVRRTDVVARIGGDEFALLFPETGYEPADVVIRKLQALLADMVQEEQLSVTFSIGAATFHQPPSSVEDLLAKADDFLYAAKREGKNRTIHQTVGESQVPSLAS